MNTETFRKLLKCQVTFMMLLALSGCIVVPTKAPVRHFEGPAVNFLVPDRTTQADVRRILGPPVVMTADNHQWIYHERGMSREYFMMIGWSGDMMDATPAQYFLLLNFDESGTLTDHHVEKNGSGCGDGICVASGKYYSIEDHENAPINDAEQGLSDQCSVYVFADRPRIGAWIGGDSVETSIDGKQIGYLLDDDTYFHIAVDSGSHELESRYIMNENTTSLIPKGMRSEETFAIQHLQFDCEGGEVHYFEHVTDRKDGTSLVRHDIHEGAKNIAKRIPLVRLVYSQIQSDVRYPVR